MDVLRHGFDDKTLSGLAAVQTLSRLNRRHDDKEDTFVLDFQNDTDDIAKAFEPYYGRTLAIPTDPNEMHTAKSALAGSGVIWANEIPPVIEALRSGSDEEQAKVYAGLEPALERFGALSKELQDEFRDDLKTYINLYSFMSQVVPYTDQTMEDWYVYCRALRSVLPHRAGDGTIDVSSKVQLTHLKVSLAEETLEEIIRQINERLGRTLTGADKEALQAYYLEKVYRSLREEAPS